MRTECAFPHLYFFSWDFFSDTGYQTLYIQRAKQPSTRKVAHFSDSSATKIFQWKTSLIAAVCNYFTLLYH